MSDYATVKAMEIFFSMTVNTMKNIPFCISYEKYFIEVQRYFLLDEKVVEILRPLVAWRQKLKEMVSVNACDT